MEKLGSNIKKFFSNFLSVVNGLDKEKFFSFFQFFLTLIVIYLFFKIVKILLKRFSNGKLSLQTLHIIKKIINYLTFIVIALTIFHKLGINISAILGAAGIAGIAIGFAAQTSISNIISGLFILTERAFKLNDIIEIDEVVGYVQSINLLSVELKTFDNQYVRVPNETIIKANLINYSHFPFRRVKTELSVAYGTDLEKVEKLLLKTAKQNQFIVKNPEPSVLWKEFAESGINLTLLTWAKTEDFGKLRNSIFIEVEKAFKKAEIEIPFPQMDIHLKENQQNSIATGSELHFDSTQMEN